MPSIQHQHELLSSVGLAPPILCHPPENLVLGNKSSSDLNALVTPSCPEDREELGEPLAVAAAPGHREHLRPGSTDYGYLEQGHWAKGLWGKMSFSDAFWYSTAKSKWCYCRCLKMYWSSLKWQHIFRFSQVIFVENLTLTTKFPHPTIFFWKKLLIMEVE